MIVAGDIGGTKTTIALFHHTAGRLDEMRSGEFASRNHGSLEEILEQFLRGTDLRIDLGCFGIAGPVIAGTCRTTNLPWRLNEGTLARAMGARRVKLLNDLEAAAYGMLHLNPEEFEALNDSETETHPGNIAVISAGTGLGEALLFWDGTQHRPGASEGGHSDFAPRNMKEIAFLNFLKEKYRSHVSYERVLSGSGLEDLYLFLRQSSQDPEPEWLTRKFENADRSAVITETALSDGDSVCIETVKTFASMYGAEAGNLALKLFAIGGVIIGGGIAPKILPVLKNGDFMNSFQSKGRYQNLLAKIPVKVALNTRAPLIGAAHFALRLARPGF